MSYKKSTSYINLVLFLIVALLAVNSFSPGGHTFIKNALAAIGVISGEGNINYLARFAGAVNPSNAIGNSLMYDNGTNVGIGTSNPAYKFVVSNSGAEGIEMAPTGGVGGGGWFQTYNRSTSAYTELSYYARAHSFWTSGLGIALTIGNTGKVGIGTSGNNEKVTVAGWINLGNETDPSFEGTTGNCITWGYRADRAPYYCIRVVDKTYVNATGTSSPYSRLQINWHTGIELGAHPLYGGTRFFDNAPGVGANQIFSVGDGDANVRVANTLIVGGGIMMIPTSTPGGLSNGMMWMVP